MKKFLQILLILALTAAAGWFVYLEFEKLLNDLDFKPASTLSSKVQEQGVPVVRYKREGLLNADDVNKLKTFLTNPYFDYYNEKETLVIAIVIEVPTADGQPYIVDAIFKDDQNPNTQTYEGFTFGLHRGEFSYWKPECLGECPFSDAFKAKYPEIAG